MQTSKVVGKDVLIRHLKRGTLSDYFAKNLQNNNKLFITFGVRTEIESDLDDEELSKEWHRLLKEAFLQRVVVKTRQKYQFQKQYKQLFYNLYTFDNGLTDGEKQIIVLACQHGIMMETNDPRLITVLNKIKLSPHMQKYTIKLLNTRNRT